MALVRQILSGRQLHIDTLCLKNNSDLAPQAVWIAGHVESHDGSSPAHRNHEGRKNPEQSRFSATIRSKQSKQLGSPHIE